jgi:peroxiredoxin
MRQTRPIALLLIGIVACTTQHAGDHDGPAVAAPTAQAGAPQLAPPLRGTLADGKSFDLQELRGDRVVLIFYRSAYCGLCTQQLRRVAEDHKAYERLHTRIVAATTDPPELIGRTAQLLDIDFPIVSVDRATMTGWGIWPDGARHPRPATFILDESGGILFQQVGKTAADRTSDATLVFTLRSFDAPRPMLSSP